MIFIKVMKLLNNFFNSIPSREISKDKTLWYPWSTGYYSANMKSRNFYVQKMGSNIEQALFIPFSVSILQMQGYRYRQWFQTLPWNPHICTHYVF